jgi:nicotinate-nucleotide adenylyltransferase
MGEDNLLSLPKWKNYELLLRDYQLYVYPRTGSATSILHNHPHVHLTATPKMEISASFIRNAIKEGKSMQYFLDKKVFDFIQAKNLYKL